MGKCHERQRQDNIADHFWSQSLTKNLLHLEEHASHACKAKAIKLLTLILSSRARGYTWIHFQSNSESQFCFSHSFYFWYCLFYTSTTWKNFLWWWIYSISVLPTMVATTTCTSWAFEVWPVQLKNWILILLFQFKYAHVDSGYHMKTKTMKCTTETLPPVPI